MKDLIVTLIGEKSVTILKLDIIKGEVVQKYEHEEEIEKIIKINEETLMMISKKKKVSYYPCNYQ